MEKRYLTKGAKETIPMTLILFMWNVHANLKDRDYLTVFEFKKTGDKLVVEHRQESPGYKKTYELEMDIEFNEKVFIYSEEAVDHNIYTMMLAEEY